MAVVAKLAEAVQKYKLKNVILAISGGVDSMALARAASDVNINAKAVIVDHQLRAESRDEAELVAERLSKLGLDCSIASLSWMQQPQSNIQGQARAARFDALSQAYVRHNADALLTAHHLDDQIETMVLRLAADSSLAGLAGIQPVAYHYSQQHDMQCRVVRPFLALRKTQLVSNCLDHDVQWVEDPSNTSHNYTRNRIREGLTMLDNDNDTLRQELIEAHEQLFQTREELDRVGRGFVHHKCKLRPALIEVDLAALQALTTAAQHHVLSGIIKLISGGRVVSDKQLTQVIEARDAKGRVDVCVYEIKAGKLLLSRAPADRNKRPVPLGGPPMVEVKFQDGNTLPGAKNGFTSRTLFDERLLVTITAPSSSALDRFCHNHQLLGPHRTVQLSIFEGDDYNVRDAFRRLNPVRRDASAVLACTQNRIKAVLYPGSNMQLEGVTVTCTRKPEAVFGAVWKMK
eukprot:TRINITY_DN7693_c0_g1_i3.p1 TRINITY_DN7693_c0_g1~~TRINITY_DN7693_c0_g1_i3.p1  ORF type:complete len:460 (+),score=82.23 TRINITY_DN7693_c0_g1_i3:3-1382(+)